MAFAPAPLVDVPARLPLPFGLFSVLSFRADAGVRWTNGVRWEAGTCAPARGIGDVDCDPATATTGLPKDLSFESNWGSASPFTVYGVWACSPVSASPERAEEFARAQLLAREEARVEQALWLGDLGNEPNLAAEVTAAGAGAMVTGEDLTVAVGELELRLAQEYGSQGVIHAPRNLALRMLGAGVAEVSGGRVRTKLGTPVVAGSGYPDQGRIIGTAPVFGWRSEVFVPSSASADLFDQRQNDLFAVAERSYLLAFDTCGVSAATIP